MKTLNLKTLLASTVLGLVLPALSYADHIHVKYNTAKNAACVIKYEYYDGDSNKVTCHYTDSSARPASNDWVSFEDTGCAVRHVDDGESAVYVTPLSKNCFVNGSGGVNVGAVGAYKTYGKDQSSNANSFFAADQLTDGSDVKNYLNGAVSERCFSKLDLKSMAHDGVALRVKLNKDGAGDHCDGKRTYFLQ
jgi:hypothetical protein